MRFIHHWLGFNSGLRTSESKSNERCYLCKSDSGTPSLNSQYPWESDLTKSWKVFYFLILLIIFCPLIKTYRFEAVGIVVFKNGYQRNRLLFYIFLHFSSCLCAHVNTFLISSTVNDIWSQKDIFDVCKLCKHELVNNS